MDPAYAIAAIKYDLAAVQMFKVAGGGGHGGSGGGGAGGSSRDASSHSSRQGVQRGGGGADGGGSSGGGQTMVQISGGKLNSNGQQQLAAWVGMGSAAGLFKFNFNGIANSRY
jgi:hypothetical protein